MRIQPDTAHVSWPINAHIGPRCSIVFKQDSTMRLFEDAANEIIRHMDISSHYALGNCYTQ